LLSNGFLWKLPDTYQLPALVRGEKPRTRKCNTS